MRWFESSRPCHFSRRFRSSGTGRTTGSFCGGASLAATSTYRFLTHAAVAIMPNLVLFTGNATPDLARKVASQLHIALGEAHVGRFSDGEIQIEINDNVRGKDVFILQSTCAPTNDNLMELIVLADALRRASAGRITAVIPYFGYARQDRRPRSARVPITAKVVADMLTTVGVDRLLTVDLHADQIQGFFDIPVDNIYASPVLLSDLVKQAYENVMVVSPDVGVGWCARVPSPSSSTTPTSPSSTSAAPRPTNRR